MKIKTVRVVWLRQKAQWQPTKALSCDGHCSPVNKARPKAKGGGCSVTLARDVSCGVHELPLPEKGHVWGHCGGVLSWLHTWSAWHS